MNFFKFDAYKEFYNGSLLSLVLPSCMVVPIREVVNKHPFTLAFNLISLQMARILAYKAIDVDNYNDIRGRTTSSKLSSRSTSITSNTLSIPYYEKIEINNNLPDKKSIDPVDSFQLSYQDNNREGISISGVTDNSFTRNLQHVYQDC